MSGQRKNSNMYEECEQVNLYLREFSPYESRESIGIDLLALTRYAKKNNKKTSELTEEEIDLFKQDK